MKSDDNIIIIDRKYWKSFNEITIPNLNINSLGEHAALVEGRKQFFTYYFFHDCFLVLFVSTATYDIAYCITCHV